MRNIMFRGKTVNQQGLLTAGSWITGGYYKDGEKVFILAWNSGGPGEYMERIEVIPETVGQFTPWKEKFFEWDSEVTKEGKAISEGDIIFTAWTCARHSVIWDETGGGFLFKNVDKEKALGGALDYYDFEDEHQPKYGMQIEGNIHEKPQVEVAND